VTPATGTHFIGISGIGMSALARILLARGETVSGSTDRRTTLVDQLEREGARIGVGHGANHLAGVREVVVSTAIAPGNPELTAARERGLPVLHRGELLARLMARSRGIAISGTHGKTTTTAMVATVLEAGGIDPTVVVGGELVDTATNARNGDGPWFLSEADESDGSFLGLRPELAVVTNIENDHIACDAELPRLVEDFERFTDRLPARGAAWFGIDDARAATLARRPRAARTRTFGFAEDAGVRAVAPRYAAFGSRFDVVVDGVPLGQVALTVPGAINVLDALPAIAIGLELGVSFATIARALAGFRGVRRRFEIVARSDRMTIVDDYAHHPTAVAATVAAARAAHTGPLVVAFQPHRYTRTQYLGVEFARALAGADRVLLTDVYAASEDPLPGVDARTIGTPLAALGADVSYARVDELAARLVAEAPPGALVLMLGAGSITAAAHELAGRIADPVAAR